MVAINQDVVGSKEFAALAELIRYEGCVALIQKSKEELEEVYTSYFLEKKKQLELLKQVDTYKEAVEKIKAIQGAERDRIKPETALFELTKEIFTCKKKGDKFIPSESDVFKKASNISGKGYLNEFIQKSDADLKDFIVRYHVLKAQIVEELEKNHEYQSAKSLKKDMEYEIEVNLKQMELSAKLSFIELKARKELES